jgi:hypothetical protein
MASEEDAPPVIKTMFFIAAMIPVVAGFEADKTGLYTLYDGQECKSPEQVELQESPLMGLSVSPVYQVSSDLIPRIDGFLIT